MPVVSAGDLTALRSEYQRTTVRLSWLVPPVLWSARINDGSIVKGETGIAFDAGTGSFFSMVEAFQEVWIGSTAGANDIGRLRLKSVSSGDGGVTGSITVGGHSHPLQDDQYLTFLHDYPLKPKYSYIEYPAEIYYMDDNVLYTDQHTKPPPVVIAGPHRAGFLDPSAGTAIFNVDASGSYTIASGATKSSYALSVASTAGAPTVNFNTGTGLGDITFSVAGYYWAKYSVTDSNGKTQISYRCYIIVEPNQSEPDYMFIDCASVQLEADWENGGWTAGIKAEDNAALADIPDHALCIIWQMPRYAGSINQITFLPDDNPAVFVGYVREDSGTQQMAEGFAEVDLVLSTVEGRLRQLFAFSTSLKAHHPAPDDWYLYEEWQTPGTIVHDLFLWRSTLLEIADVIGLRDDTLNRMFQGFDEGNIYDNANNFLYSEAIRKKVLSDQGGRLHIVEDQQLMIDSDRNALTTSFPLIQTDAIADYGAVFAIQRKQEFTAPFVTAGGMYWDGNTWDDDDRPHVPDSNIWCSIAPGGKPLWEGPDPQDFPKQTVSSQAHLNQICGRYEAKINNPVTEVVVEFHGMYNTVLDIAYGERHTISLQASETPRGIAWADKPLYTKHIQAVYEAGTGFWAVNAAFEPENITTDGVSTECPSFPPLGGEIPPPPGGVDGEPAGALLTGASVNFKSALSGLWEQRLTQDVKDLIEDPYWRTKTSSTSPDDAIAFRCGVGYIKRTTDAFDAVDVDVTPSNNPPNDAGDSPAPTATGVTYIMIEGSYPNQDEFAVLTRWQNASSEWRSWIAFTDDNGSTWSWKSLEAAIACEGFGTKSSNFSTGSWSIERQQTINFYHRGNNIIEVASGKYVVWYWDDSDLKTYVQAFGLSGDTVTWGTAQDLDVVRSGCAICRVDANKFAVVHNNVAINNELIHTRICTVSGVTISLGSAQEFPTSMNGTIRGDSIGCPNSSTIVLTGFFPLQSGYANEWFVIWGSISGSTITWGTRRDIEVDVSLFDYGQSVTIPVGSSGLVGYGGNYSLGPHYFKIFGFTATENSASSLITVGRLPEWRGRDFNLFELTSTKAIAIWISYGSPRYLKAAVITMSGATPTKGADNILATIEGYQLYHLCGSALSSVQAVISYKKTNESCHTISTINISGDTITLDETCDYMNKPVGPVKTYSTTKFMLMGEDSEASNDGVMWSGITVANIETCSGASIADSYAMGLSIGKSVGGTAWVTVVGNDILELLEITLSTMTIANRFSLGSATFAQAIAQTYLAYPFVPFGYEDAVYVYGRMNDPQSLGDPAHIIRTEDGGSSFGLIEDGWGFNHCGALILDLSNQLFAIRNTPTGSKLYVDDADNILVLKLTLPFFAQVAPHGMLLDYYTLDVYVCAWSPDVWMVGKIAPPYLAASNLTFDHDATAGIESIIVL